jgi:hypothetical protein
MILNKFLKKNLNKFFIILSVLIVIYLLSYYYKIKLLENFDDTVILQKDEIVKLQTKLNPDKCLGVDSSDNLNIIDCNNDGSNWTYTSSMGLKNNLKNRFLINNQDKLVLSTDEIVEEEELKFSKNNDREVLTGTNYLCVDKTIRNKCTNDVINQRGPLLMI